MVSKLTGRKSRVVPTAALAAIVVLNGPVSFLIAQGVIKATETIHQAIETVAEEGNSQGGARPIVRSPSGEKRHG
ncbi:MAG: hypothetical protein IH963_03175 [Chloroflexi bacterium]|nr:hypothetical protein [Chloroflexota bacterium]